MDLTDAVALAATAGITTAAGMLDLLTEAYSEAMLTPRVQYAAELVANDVAGILDRGLDL